MRALLFVVPRTRLPHRASRRPKIFLIFFMQVAAERVTNRPVRRYYEKGVYGMTEQRKMELVKALAYGEMPERAAAAENVGVAEALEIRQSCAAEIAGEREILTKAGYLDG